MICPLCGTRKAKRACPALGQSICPVCCATKRLKEINCPADCRYLSSAQAHPAAVVQRQRERDLPLLLQLLEGVTDPQARVLGVLQQQVHAYRATALPPLRDADVEEATRALASTLETASRGIVYEHHPSSLPAQRVMSMLQATCDELSHQDRSLRPAAVAAVLRRLERAAHEATRVLPPQATPETTFLDFLDRVTGGRARQGSGLVTGPDDGEAGGRDDAPRLIIP
jgi:hypothetical protein